MSTVSKVTVSMTERDIQNAEQIYKYGNARTKSDAVGRALAIASHLYDSANKGYKILIEDNHGKTRELVLTGLT